MPQLDNLLTMPYLDSNSLDNLVNSNYVSGKILQCSLYGLENRLNYIATGALGEPSKEEMQKHQKSVNLYPDFIKKDKSSKDSNKTPEEKYIPNERLGVFLIDMQQKFLDKIDSEEKEREIPKIIEVLEYCKKTETPVFVFEYNSSGETIKQLKEKLNELKDVTYVTKGFEDAFKGTKLYGKIGQKNIDYILFMGINASACVLQTAKTAAILDKKIITSPDLIAEPSNWKRYESADWYEENGICIPFEEIINNLKEGKINNYEFPEREKLPMESDRYKFIPKEAWENGEVFTQIDAWGGRFPLIIWDKNKNNEPDREEEAFVDFNEDGIPDDTNSYDWD